MRTLLSLVAGTALFAAGASAQVVTFNLSSEYSGAASPAGVAPWLRATFTTVAVGEVSLTLDAGDAADLPGLTGNEFVGLWVFNSAVATSGLDFTVASTVGTITDPTITKGSNDQNADGAHDFDLLFSFSETNSDPGRFGAGEAITFTITGTGITASTFDLLSGGGGGHGPYPTAAHVQGIAPDANNKTSGFITVPEPSTYALALGLIVLGFVAVRRFRNRKQII